MQLRKEDDKTLTIRFFADMEDMKIFNLLTLFYETDLYPLWFPHCKRTNLVHKYHKAKKMVFSRIGMPGLMADRENVMIGMGVNRLDVNGCLYVLSRSIHYEQEYQGVGVPKLDKGKVPLDIKYFGFEIKPTSSNGVSLRSVMNFNPHIKYVPQWLINFANKHFAKMMFEKMMKYSRSFKGTKFEKRVDAKSNQDFYDWIRLQINTYFAKQGWPIPPTL